MNASHKERATSPDDTFDELSAAIESGAGLPAPDSIATESSSNVSSGLVARSLCDAFIGKV